MWRSISVIRMKPWRRVRSWTRVPMRKRQLHTNWKAIRVATHERYTSELMSDSGEIRKVAMKTTNCVPQRRVPHMYPGWKR